MNNVTLLEFISNSFNFNSKLNVSDLKFSATEAPELMQDILDRYFLDKSSSTIKVPTIKNHLVQERISHTNHISELSRLSNLENCVIFNMLRYLYYRKATLE